MKPFFISLCLSALAALATGWWQHTELDRLRAEKFATVRTAQPNASTDAKSPAAVVPDKKAGVAEKIADSPSMLRNLINLFRGYETLTIEGLEEHFRDQSASGLLPGGIGMEQAGKFVIAAAALGRRAPEDTLSRLLDQIARSHADHHQFAALVVWIDWLLRDRKAAIRWLQESRVSDKGPYVQAAQMYIGPTEPGISATLAEVLPDSESVTRAVESSLVTLATTDPEGALAKLDTVTDPDIREQIRRSAFETLRPVNPMRALEIAQGDTPEGISERSHAVMTLAASDGKAALQWLSAQDAATREHVIRERGLLNAVGGGATEADFHAVAATLDPDPAKALIQQHDAGFAFSDPHAALVRVEKETNRERRNNYLLGAAEALTRKGQESVMEEWLQAHPEFAGAADVAGTVEREKTRRAIDR